MSKYRESSPLIQDNGRDSYNYRNIQDSNRYKRYDDGDSDPLKPASQVVTRRHYLLWPAVFIFVSAYKMTFNAFGQYVYIFLQNENFPGLHINRTTAFCEVNTTSINFLIQMDVQQKAAKWSIYFYLAGGITALFSNFVFGSLTDRYGRKFLFVLPCIGTILRTVLTIIGMNKNLPLYFYIPGYFLEGCTGQIFNIFQISYIYVADITPPGKRRSLGIVIVEIAIGLGTALPAIIVGYILEAYNSFILPYYISVALLIVSLALILLLPETYPKEVREKRQYTSSIENLKDAVGLFFGSWNKGRRWMYVITLAVFLFTAYDACGRLSMEGLYLLNFPFCWGPTKLGIFGTLRIICQQFIGMGLVRVLQACMTDEIIAIVRCISYGLSFIIEAYATNDSMMYIVIFVGTFGLLTLPMIRSIMSQMTSPDKQGAVFASISATEATINLIGAVTSSSVYMATVKINRGFTFIMFFMFNVVSLILLIVFIIGSRRSKYPVRYDNFVEEEEINRRLNSRQT